MLLAATMATAEEAETATTTTQLDLEVERVENGYAITPPERQHRASARMF